MGNRRHGFTLVELLVVIAIIGILVGLLLPAVQAAREAARRTQCSNNLKQLMLAMHNYESSVKSFPSGAILGKTNPPTAWFGYPNTTWTLLLYPYLEQGPTYDRYDFNRPGYGGVWLAYETVNCVGPNAPTAVVVSSLLCPSDGMGGKVFNSPFVAGAVHNRSNYAGFFGNLDQGRALTPNTLPSQAAVFGYNKPTTLSMIIDGTSNTMAVGEYLTGLEPADPRGTHWFQFAGWLSIFTKLPPNSVAPDVIYPYWCPSLAKNRPDLNLPCIGGNTVSNVTNNNTAAARSRHPGGVQVGLCDGSVRFISSTVDLAVWQALGSTAGRETVGEF